MSSFQRHLKETKREIRVGERKIKAERKKARRTWKSTQKLRKAILLDKKFLKRADDNANFLSTKARIDQRKNVLRTKEAKHRKQCAAVTKTRKILQALKKLAKLYKASIAIVAKIHKIHGYKARIEN